MKQIKMGLIIISITALSFTACKKKSDSKSFDSALGCEIVNTTDISEIPYLTSPEEMIAAITIDAGCEAKVYKANGETPATDIESGYKLSIEKDDEIRKTFTLYKQELEVEAPVVTGPLITDFSTYTGYNVTSPCYDKASSKATARTTFFQAEKDSTYTIYAWNGDSAGGIGYITCKDSLGNIYVLDQPSKTNAGTWITEENDANQYTLTSAVTGRLFIETYGLFPGPSETHYLNTSVFIWIRKN